MDPPPQGWCEGLSQPRLDSGRWPPQTAEVLKDWLEYDLPCVRSDIEDVAMQILHISGTAYVPYSARLSQIKVARTSTSDPTFQTVLKLADHVPELRKRYFALYRILSRYEGAKAILDPDDELQIIEMRYDGIDDGHGHLVRLKTDEITSRLRISRTSYYRIRSEALDAMWRLLRPREQSA